MTTLRMMPVRHVRSVSLTELERIAKKLSLFPSLGRPGDDVSPGIRILIFEKRVTIAYRIDDAGVRIVRLFYAGRDYSVDQFPD